MAFAGEKADLRVVPTLRQVVAGLQSVFASTKLAGGSRGEVIGERQKDLGSKCLQQGAPGFSRQGGLEGTDALRRDDRNAFRLPGKAEEFFIACRFTLADRGEVLVFVAEETELAGSSSRDSSPSPGRD